MIVSLLYNVTRKLLTVPSVLPRHGTAKDAELLVLRHENAVPRRQLAGPFRYEPADRFSFAALSALIPRRHWLKISPVTPGTLLAWHRRFIAAKWEGAPADPRGTCPTRASDRRLDGVGDPQRGRYRPRATSLRPHPARVPDRASRGHHRGRLHSHRHSPRQADVRAGVPQARHPAAAHHRDHRPPDPELGGAAGAESHRRPGHTHPVPAFLAARPR
ncbi:putative Transposase [Streptomyces himastatinicus ATCC 53653]|uniref:Putative Transposase n=1 Tax=Streptomyces himastatinicus ATCC 53653 TaxID=457427 RepID=D9WIY1_9ACTN|nr:putative Transposase [Streptomyces himastatinicus ATCC 53653]